MNIEDFLNSPKNKNNKFDVIEYILYKLEEFLHNLFRKSDNETKANLSVVEWVIYIGSLIFVLVMITLNLHGLAIIGQL